jgi:hypothetical protein
MVVRRLRLQDAARVVRSKNAGPFELTLDVFFQSAELFHRVRDLGAINPVSVARRYRLPSSEAVKIYWFEPASALKITLPRWTVSGGLGDRDVFGAQQHVPLMEWEFEFEE